MSCFLFKLIPDIQFSELTSLDAFLKGFASLYIVSLIATKKIFCFINLCFVNGKHLLHSGFHFYLFPLKFLEMLAKHDEFIPGKFIYVLEGKFYDFLLLRLLTVAFFLKLVTANLLDRYI